MSEPVRAVPYFCPFCGEEDLRPTESPRNGWLCRSCARVFSVSMDRLERSLVPGHRAATEDWAAAEARTTIEERVASEGKES